MNKSFFHDYRFRIIVLGFIALCGAGVLIAKLYYEQLHKSDAYMQRISRQSVRQIRIPARRGKILTSDMQVLANNVAGCMILFYPEEMRIPGSRSRTIQYIAHASATISKALNRPDPLTKEKISRHLYVTPGLPITLFRGLTTSEIAPALSIIREFKGIGLEQDDARDYPEGKMLAHQVGYTRRENPNAAADRKEFFYYVPDQVGVNGLEKAFEKIPNNVPELGLRGVPGYAMVIVDILGFIYDNQLDRKDPVDGNNLILTIDSKAQKIAEQTMQGKSGSFILLDADSGAVLAMVSSPTPDLGRYTPILPQAYYNTLLHNPEKPLLNRARYGLYTPGSIIKVLVAMALLNGGVDPKETEFCQGRAVIGTGSIRCTGHHGDVDMERALECSCNVYFIKKGIKLGMESIVRQFSNAGVGKVTGFDLNERSGLLPSDDYKRRVYGSSWNSFDTGQISIGQGIVLLTPLQVATYVAAIANGGRLMCPFIADRIVNEKGDVLWRNYPQQRDTLDISKENLEIIRNGMFRVVNSPTGSGRRAKTSAITLYGKTGTAEIGSVNNRTKNTWFIAFGSHNNRRYAVAMLEEKGISGGTNCAPYVASFFEKYLAELP